MTQAIYERFFFTCPDPIIAWVDFRARTIQSEWVIMRFTKNIAQTGALGPHTPLTVNKRRVLDDAIWDVWPRSRATELWKRLSTRKWKVERTQTDEAPHFPDEDHPQDFFRSAPPING